MEAEGVRDAALAASGLLNPEIGGKSVFPPQPEGASKLGQIQREWVEATDEQRFRRGMYTYFWRASPHPGLMVFDAPDSTNACTRRPRSNTPLQALTLLNDKAYYEFAQGMAKRVLHDGGASNADRLDYAFELCVARPPDSEERSELSDFSPSSSTSCKPTRTTRSKLPIRRSLLPGRRFRASCSTSTSSSRASSSLRE
ncbi:MAG: DUF1553 domain-containing protein [Bryobacterales bacterium]